MLIQRRISIQLIEKYDINVDINLVPSDGNLAEVLTRVRSNVEYVAWGWLPEKFILVMFENEEMRSFFYS